MENNIIKKIRRMFGTDGVRDIANRGMMTPETAVKLGRAYVAFIKKQNAETEKPRIAVGRDTRYSGQMLECALIAGIASGGGEACDLGVIPTPGVSYVVANNEFDGGAVISASHNPAEYNGIKFLDRNGFKLTDDDEICIEAFFENDAATQRPIRGGIGLVAMKTDYIGQYIQSLVKLADKIDDKDYPIVVDAANGAAYDIVGRLFGNWRGKVTLSGNEPDGLNINYGVGVTHMEYICAETRKAGARIGIAYDGDTDRVLMCDGRGRILDGDIMLWVIGRWFAKNGKLGSGVAATVMSNMALEDHLAEDGIKVFRCDVGDRYVLDTMQKEGCRLGGEQSGHIIALDYANTGDGLCSGTLFLMAASELGEDISTLVDRFDKYPQVLRNLKIKNKSSIMEDPRLTAAAEEAKKLLSGRGRMLLRPSGTEPLIRIFVEARDEALMARAADIIEDQIYKIIDSEE
mgnify:CR=1 FL=1